MSTNLRELINSLDSRHTDALPILHAFSLGAIVPAVDIDVLDSRFAQVAPLLHKLNAGKRITAGELKGLDSFTGQRLRRVLIELNVGIATKQTKRTKAAKKRAPARKK